MSSCCHEKDPQQPLYKRLDWLFLVSSLLVAMGYAGHFIGFSSSKMATFSHGVYELMNTMAWGLVIGIIMVGLLSVVPKAFVMKILGKGGSFSGVLRATFAGILLDLCSHGILLVSMQLYRRGASLGQVMAFLIASPWNSLSLTIILVALIGLKWTLIFIALSMIIAVISGVIFEVLVKKGLLPENPNSNELPEEFAFFKEAKNSLSKTKFNFSFFKTIAKNGFHESEMLLRWIFLGVVLAAALRTFVDPEQFSTFFGPTVMGLIITLGLATIIEVCSEGTSPIAADILNRAKAPGNSFAFLMAGASTDYTEIIALKETTKSWKISLFLPFVTLPQIIAVSYIINVFS